MADIIPFRGELYNPEKIYDLSKVVAPPYDVISSEEQEKLYVSEPHNIIRILLGKDSPEDNEKDNKYTRAARFLKDWQEREVLKKDREPSIYAYLQEFAIDGQLKRRLGFMALLKLEEFGVKRSSIYPHENTLLAPKEDRAKLIQSIEANLGPIFALFADDDKYIDAILERATKTQPILDILDHYGIKNKLWRISDKDIVLEITHLMKNKKIFIADGHHRYEVGLEFSKIKKDPKYGYILTYFTDLYADGIVILPVHRLIAGVNSDILFKLEKELERNFVIKELASKDNIKDFLYAASGQEKRFVVYDGKTFMGLSLEQKDSLDASIVHDLIIEPLKKEHEGLGEKISIDFTKDLHYAVKEVDKKRFSLAIFLNPTKVTQVRDIAFSGNRMPQKSTYFYPKVLTGLVINAF